VDTADAVAKARARAPLVDILFRMSLRSVAANAKWVQRIFVVTDSPPSWLLSGAAAGRVTVVPTSAIMPADHLPTFNSHAVEANLHKVPGLSECYVYMNADYFFGRPSSLADFVDLEKGQYKIILEMDRTSAAASQLSRPPASHDAAFRNANMLLDGWAIANSNKGIERHFVPHAPHFFRKSLVEQLAAKAATQFSATSSHRFRSFEDVHVAYLHAYCAHPSAPIAYFSLRFLPSHERLLSKIRPCCWFGYVRADLLEQPHDFLAKTVSTTEGTPTPDKPTYTVYLFNGPRQPTSFYAELDVLRDAAQAGGGGERMPQFFSINDAMDDEGSDHIVTYVRDSLLAIFPSQSEFEGDSGSGLGMDLPDPGTAKTCPVETCVQTNPLSVPAVAAHAN
jgi:hypothetical protein